MARRLVNAEELLHIVNESLLEALGPLKSGDKTLISGVYRVNEPDAAGCNWTPGFYLHEKVDDAKFARVIAELQDKYNLAE